MAQCTCTNCKRELLPTTKLSAEIPSQADCKYGICSYCGNVMVMLVDGNEIIEVVSTPVESDTAMAQMMEAYDLFTQVGFYPASYSMSSGGTRRPVSELKNGLQNSQKAPEEPEDIPGEEEHAEEQDCDCDGCDGCDETKPSVIQKIKTFFRNLFSKSA